MSKLESIIKGGTIVTAAETYQADIGIIGGQIVTIDTDLTDADAIINATGLLVLPGGICSHVHTASVF